MWTDDVWVADSTPVECARSREAVARSDLAGWVEYGYCASHSRFFWGLRLHLLATLQRLPVGFALAGAKADERQTLLGIFDTDPTLLAEHPGQTLIADKSYFGRDFETELAEAGVDRGWTCYARPARARRRCRWSPNRGRVASTLRMPLGIRRAPELGVRGSGALLQTVGTTGFEPATP